MRQRTSTRALVEGALFAVLTALLGLMGVYVPPLQLITNFVWTLPIIVLIIRNDMRVGIMATVIASLLLFLFSDPVSAAMLFLQFGALGITYGYFFKKQASAGKTLFYGTLVALISTVVAMSFSFAVVGVKPQEMFKSMEASITPTIEMYRQLGLLAKLKASGMTETQLRDMLKAMVEMSKMLLPAGLVLAAMFSAFINFVMARFLLRKLAFQVPEMPPFTNWRLPWYSIWGFIVGLSAILIAQYYNIVWLGNVGKNVLYVYFPFLFAIGLSVATYFFKSEKVLPMFKAIAIFFSIINIPVAIFIILTLGLFDPLTDYRRLERRDV